MLEIQSIAIELADPRGSNHNAVRILERQDIQRSVHGIAEGLIDMKSVTKLWKGQEILTVVRRLSGAEFHISI